MPSRNNPTPSEPPSLTPDKSIPLIRRQIERLAEIEQLPYNDPRIGAWESTTRDVLDNTFGKPQGQSHRKTNEALFPHSGALRISMTPGEMQRNHIRRSQNRRALLEAYVEQLQDGLMPPVLATPGYRLHPEIERVSGDLLHDGHFKQAALEAFIRVINAVKDDPVWRWMVTS
jgi:hypothetical protein